MHWAYAFFTQISKEDNRKTSTSLGDEPDPIKYQLTRWIFKNICSDLLLVHPWHVIAQATVVVIKTTWVAFRNQRTRFALEICPSRAAKEGQEGEKQRVRVHNRPQSTHTYGPHVNKCTLRVIVLGDLQQSSLMRKGGSLPTAI